MLEAAPADDATAEKKKEHKENEKEFLKGLGLKRQGGMLPKLMEAAKRRRDVENCEDLKEAILPPIIDRNPPGTRRTPLKIKPVWFDGCWNRIVSSTLQTSVT